MAEIAAGQATIEDLQKQVRQQQLTLTTKDLELENEKARADLAETVVTTTQGRAAGRKRHGLLNHTLTIFVMFGSNGTFNPHYLMFIGQIYSYPAAARFLRGE